MRTYVVTDSYGNNQYFHSMRDIARLVSVAYPYEVRKAINQGIELNGFYIDEILENEPIKKQIDEEIEKQEKKEERENLKLIITRLRRQNEELRKQNSLLRKVDKKIEDLTEILNSYKEITNESYK